MPLSWNEIKDRALAFSREWADAVSEDAEAKSFWDQFFAVFGVTRRRVASFEAPVKKADGAGGFIDLLWKGVLLVEHKSRGKNLDRAFRQALDYFPGLKERDLPRYVLVSDFARFRLYDLDADQIHDVALAELYQHVRLFGFMAGYQTRSFGQEDPVNIAAAEKLGRLHDGLKEAGYAGHALEVLLVRLLFCLFAEDTAIFERQQFRDYLEARTREDGSDLGPQLAQLFQVLNTPPEQRFRTLDEQLTAFPHINGRLFAEPLPLAAFDRALRELLLDASALDWSRISPAIFGSLFQSILDPAARRHWGAHYTTETNILKALRPLLLDGLRAEFERVRRNSRRLLEFQRQLAMVRVLDPACGCGNFLVVAYRELRLLELAVLRELYQTRTSDFLDVSQIVLVDVDQFYGIELAEFPAQIAQVALWLTDHQMNLRVSEEFGQYFIRLPLKKAPHIVHGNALTVDWRTIVKPADITVIVGNPPFVGKAFQNEAQKSEIATVFQGVKGFGVLDYVTCWYRKAVDFITKNPAIRVAFVSTNSITQGEQVGVLWPDLLQRGIQINFAHRTFQWSSEARGKAAVHCVIIGFGQQDTVEKWLFDYETPKADPYAIRAININPYLVDAASIALEKRRSPICLVPPIVFGSMPNDGGHLLFSPIEKEELIIREPRATKWLYRLLGSDEFINGRERWCLWLIGISPEELRSLPAVLERVEAVRRYRLASSRTTTRELAATPAFFGEIRHPKSGDYLLIPRVSSEQRPIIPMALLPAEIIATDANLIIPLATLYHFGVLSSTMHMAWVRAVCGRLKSDYRYSAGIVYNNFPWPEENPPRPPFFKGGRPDGIPFSKTGQEGLPIETAAQVVLDIRARFPNATLADLYDPLTMPPELLKAHRALDRAVDMAYGKTAFATEAERVAFLFDRYQQLTSLLPAEGAKRTKKRKPPR